MRIIINKVNQAQELDKMIEVKHWYGTTTELRTEYSIVYTFEYEVTDLSNELQMFVNAMYKKRNGYILSNLDTDILKAKSNILGSEPIGIGDGYYNMKITHNSLKFIPTNFIDDVDYMCHFYKMKSVPLPKRDNVDFLQQRLIDLEDEIRYVIKLHNNDKTIEEK